MEPRPKRLVGLIGVAGSAGARFFAAGCTQHAAGIAYRVLFSLAPLAIVLVSVFGLVLQDDDVRERVVDRVIEALPVDAAGREDVEDAIETIATPTSAAGLVSLLVFLWAASGMMAALRRGLAAAMGVPRRTVARGKLVDLALVAGAAVLVLLSVGIGLVAKLAHEIVVEVSEELGFEVGAEGRAIALALPFLLWIGTSLLLYRFVPAAGLRLQDALAGAVVTGAHRSGDLPRVGPRLREDQRVEHRLRLADERARVPLLRVSDSRRAALRSRRGRGVVGAAHTVRRVAARPLQAGARAARSPG